MVAPAKTHRVSSGPVADSLVLPAAVVGVAVGLVLVEEGPLELAELPEVVVVVVGGVVLLVLERSVELAVPEELLVSPGSDLGLVVGVEIVTLGFFTVTSVLWKWRQRKTAAITSRTTNKIESSHRITRICKTPIHPFCSIKPKNSKNCKYFVLIQHL